MCYDLDIVFLTAEKNEVQNCNVLFMRLSSVALSCLTLCDPVDCSMPGFPVHHQLPELAQTHVHRVSDIIQLSHLILCRPLLLLPSIFPSLMVFSKESVLCIRWPNYRSFSFSISPSNEYSGLISFRTWFDILAVQEFSPVPQFKSINSSALSFFFFYSPTLTSIDDYWKNHSFDYMDLCWQSNVSAF